MVGVAAAFVAVAAWGYASCSRANHLARELEASRQYAEARAALDASLSRIREVRDITLGMLALRDTISAAVAAAEKAEAEKDLHDAARDAADVDAEFQRTGRVTESLRKVHREVTSSAP